MNWRALSFLGLLTTLSCAHDPVKTENSNPAAPPPDQPIAVHHTTQLDKLQAAIQPYVEKARSTYPPIKARYLAGLPDGAALFITVQLHDAQAKMEQVFVQVEKIEDAQISGIIWDDIRTVQGFHKGQRYTFPESDLIDWTLSNADGTEEGNVVGNFLDTWHGEVP
jgi:hypothetical protein